MKKKSTITDVLKNFTEGKFSEGLEKIAEAIDKFDHKKILDNTLDNTYKEIKNEINEMIKKPLSNRLERGADKIIGHVSNGIKDISEEKFNSGFDKFKKAGKEFLECVGKLFGAIKEGLVKGFDKVKNVFKSAYEKLESLCQTREQAR